MDNSSKKIKNYTTLEKIWLIPVLIYVFSLLMLIVVDGLVGFYTILFDLETWNHNILHLFHSKWSVKLFIVVFLYNFLMVFITIITPQNKR